jgi:hypothetical protein
MQAEKEVDMLKNWDQVYSSSRKYSHCDDGSIGEGYSDAIGKILANDWNQLGKLLSLTRSNKPFQGFVLKHVNSTVSSDDLEKIVSNARTRCPTGGESLCGLVLHSATEALNSLKRLGLTR